MNSKIIHLSCHAFVTAVFICLGSQAAHAQTTESTPMVRLICAGGLGEAQEVVLATKSENAGWKEVAKTELRDPMVSNWLPSQYGEIHLLRQKNGKAESFGHFTHAEGIRRAVVILTANEEAKICRAVVLDPEKLGFKEGTTVIINASKMTGTATLGTETVTVEAGKNLLAKPAPDETGGYRVMVESPGAQGTKQVCYDRYTTGIPNARNIIVLLPDPNVTLRVTSLSEFGPFE